MAEGPGGDLATRPPHFIRIADCSGLRWRPPAALAGALSSIDPTGD